MRVYIFIYIKTRIVVQEGGGKSSHPFRPIHSILLAFINPSHLSLPLISPKNTLASLAVPKVPNSVSEQTHYFCSAIENQS